MFQCNLSPLENLWNSVSCDQKEIHCSWPLVLRKKKHRTYNLQTNSEVMLSLQAVYRDSVARWIFLWRSKHFNQHFLCMRWLFSKPFKSFSLPYTLINFLFDSLNLLTNFENAYWNLLRIRCSLVSTSHWLQGKCTRLNLSQAASGISSKNHRRLPVNIFSLKTAALGALKRVTGRIFKISK